MRANVLCPRVVHEFGFTSRANYAKQILATTPGPNTRTLHYLVRSHCNNPVTLTDRIAIKPMAKLSSIVYFR